MINLEIVKFFQKTLSSRFKITVKFPSVDQVTYKNDNESSRT